ncbi:hypothetical protein [Halobellus ordinarius]|uniref:hypothetical protein n=1 Tax=Halobellus ordinarius TaxID=3075120 RepID=UPI0028809701|nr:hypothetical protein [Halobellus sp. ZY16]
MRNKLSNWKTGSTAATALLLLVVGGALISGTAAAAVLTDTTNFASVGTDVLVEKNMTVDNETDHIYVDLDNSTGDVETVNTTLYGVENGTETQVEKVQIEAPYGTVENYEYTSIDSANYSEYRVVVEGDSTTTNATYIAVGTPNSGGGSTPSSGIDTKTAGMIAVVLVGGYIFLKEDDR